MGLPLSPIRNRDFLSNHWLEHRLPLEPEWRAHESIAHAALALYDANSELLKGQNEDDVEGNTLRLVEYWSNVSRNMSDWTKVLAGHKLATDLRAESISAHSTVLRALGGLGVELMKHEDWKDRLKGLADIDWSKTNPEWQDVCIVANSVVSNRQARAATKGFVKAKLGLDLSESEQRSIDRSNDRPGAATQH